MFATNFGWKNMFLHAGKLEFIHPFTKRNLILKADFSEDWLQLFSTFGWKNPIEL